MAHRIGRTEPKRTEPRRGVPIADRAATAVLAGHPWVYRDALGSLPAAVMAGDVVDLVDQAGSFLARAVVDPASPIGARILTLDEGEPIDDRFFAQRLDAAFALRDAFVAGPDTTAYRLCNGEGDRLPGIVIDRYEQVAVVRTDGDAATAWIGEKGRLRPVLEQRLRALGLSSIARRDTSKGSDRATKLDGLAGDPPPATVIIREHGLRMEIDLARGQKTGAFLDQRENRRRVRAFAGGRRVLNLFSYAGGFSLAAVAGGAAHVTSVDIASGGHATAQRSWRENGFDPARATFVTADAFLFLEQAAARGETWDLVISDPPSFAPSEKTKARALTAYRRLHGACVRVLAPGGIFGAASCSSHVDVETFLATLDARALGGAHVPLLDVFGPPPDHPTLPAWREGRYLKFAILRRG